MKYIIQIFKSVAPNVGNWTETAWGGNDLNKVKETAAAISKHNTMNIKKVRIVEVITELNCNGTKS